MVDHEHTKDRAVKLQGARVKPERNKKSFFDSPSAPISPPFTPYLHNFTICLLHMALRNDTHPHSSPILHPMQCTLTKGLLAPTKTAWKSLICKPKKKGAQNTNLMCTCQEPLSSAKVQACLLLLLIFFINFFFFTTALQKHLNAHWKFLKCYGSLYIRDEISE